MLDDNRIKEAEKNMKEYLFEDLIIKKQFKKIIYDTFLRNHEESLNLAEEIFQQKLSSLWVVVVSYYSMFYLANATIYKLGYKIGDLKVHKITVDALITLVKDKLENNLIEQFEEEKEEALTISKNLLESYEYEKEKRSYFQYETTEEIKTSKAQTSLNRAKKFSLELKKLLLKI